MKNYLKITINNKVFSNSIWMILEKIISVFGLLFVTSYVAKYIGPSNFGILTYVASIVIYFWKRTCFIQKDCKK